VPGAIWKQHGNNQCCLNLLLPTCSFILPTQQVYKYLQDSNAKGLVEIQEDATLKINQNPARFSSAKPMLWGMELDFPILVLWLASKENGGT